MFGRARRGRGRRDGGRTAFVEEELERETLSTEKLRVTVLLVVAGVGAAFSVFPVSYLSPNLEQAFRGHAATFVNWRFVVRLSLGVLTGLVAQQIKKRLLDSFKLAEERDEVVNTFGQHVSPAVAGKLLQKRATLSGERGNVCVMFLDPDPAMKAATTACTPNIPRPRFSRRRVGGQCRRRRRSPKRA